MQFDYLIKNTGNSFYPVTKEEIVEVEEALNCRLPKELTSFFLTIGYGFFKSSLANFNRLMDPYSIRDFKLKRNDFEFYADMELYEHLEDRLVFFEVSTALLAIELTEKETSRIYYDDRVIADSLAEFVRKLSLDETYFWDDVE